MQAEVTKIPNLATNGFVKTGSSNGTLSVDTATYATAGAATGSGLTMNTSKLLGRTTASSGAIEEIGVSGLTLASGTLTASASTVGLGNVTNDAQVKKAASSTSGAIPTWNGTTGDSLNTGGLTAPSGTIVGTSDTQTLTNKRITKRTGSTTSSATPTINTDNVDMYLLTAQAVDITSFTTNLSGTPTEGQTLWISITGTAARAITWGTSFEASTVALPTTTVTTARLDVGFVWNSATSKWRCVASS